MGRFASSDDIAKAIALLADPQESAFVNGHALAVDGGWTADGSWESSASATADLCQLVAVFSPRRIDLPGPSTMCPF